MILTRFAKDRGHTKIDWLDSYHSFSFGDYYDRDHMGFRDLRVINEDRVQPSRGFATHAHRNMEIITYILEGALEHKDSMGNGSVIRPGEVQRMSAGTGVTHSEYNPSRSEPVHFLQIWILPKEVGLPPGYEQKKIDLSAAKGALVPIATPDGAGGSVKINQDVTVAVSILEPGQVVQPAMGPSRHLWLQVARGAAQPNGINLNAGDGAAITSEPHLEIRAIAPSEILVFDLL
ncbi:MAG TPA: pirin family protein [Candidatus Binataceae bacterium]